MSNQSSNKWDFIRYLHLFLSIIIIINNFTNAHIHKNITRSTKSSKGYGHDFGQILVFVFNNNNTYGMHF